MPGIWSCSVLMLSSMPRWRHGQCLIVWIAQSVKQQNLIFSFRKASWVLYLSHSTHIWLGHWDIQCDKADSYLWEVGGVLISSISYLWGCNPVRLEDIADMILYSTICCTLYKVQSTTIFQYCDWFPFGSPWAAFPAPPIYPERSQAAFSLLAWWSKLSRWLFIWYDG